jgi:hypothetical protein
MGKQMQKILALLLLAVPQVALAGQISILEYTSDDCTGDHTTYDTFKDGECYNPNEQVGAAMYLCEPDGGLVGYTFDQYCQRRATAKDNVSNLLSCNKNGKGTGRWVCENITTAYGRT